MSIYKEMGRRMLATRNALGITQEKVAELSGIETSFYGQIERGANIPSLATIAKIAKVLGLEIQDLFFSKKSLVQPEIKAVAEMLSALSSSDRKMVSAVVRTLCTRLKKS